MKQTKIDTKGKNKQTEKNRRKSKQSKSYRKIIIDNEWAKTRTIHFNRKYKPTDFKTYKGSIFKSE
jgi:hypothetical protein